MKFIEKIKNYFYDDEEVDTKVDNSPKVEPVPTKSKPETRVEKREENVPKEENIDAISERELFKSEPTFNFPIIFDDEDFKEEKISRSSIKNTRVEQPKVVERVEPKVFKPSLNISPVYGILGDSTNKANGSASEKKDNLIDLYNNSKKVDIDTVLDKVYSQQKRVDLNSGNYNNVEEDVKPVQKDDLTIDLFNNTDETREELKSNNSNNDLDNSLSKVDDKLKSIDDLLDNTDENDFYSLVDSMYKDDNEESDK